MPSRDFHILGDHLGLARRQLWGQPLGILGDCILWGMWQPQLRGDKDGQAEALGHCEGTPPAVGAEPDPERWRRCQASPDLAGERFHRWRKEEGTKEVALREEGTRPQKGQRAQALGVPAHPQGQGPSLRPLRKLALTFCSKGMGKAGGLTRN